MRSKKRAHRLIYVPLLLTLFCFVGNLNAQNAQHEHSVRGVTVRVQLIQGTKDGGEVSSLPVELNVYEHGEMVQHLESKSDTEGVAVFSGVMLGEHRTARAGTKYKNMHFSSKAFGYIPGHAVASSQVMVYEVSYDNSPLSLDTSHIIIELTEDGIKVTEYAELVNPTDKAISAEKSGQENLSKVLYLEPFNGFRNLEFSSYFVTNAILVTEEGFYDTMAMPPGSHQAGYSYILDLDSETIDLTKKVTLPIGGLIIFSKLVTGKISGLGAPTGTMVAKDGIDSEYFSLSNVKSGDVVKFKAVGLNYRKSNKNQTIIMGVVFALMAGLVGFRMIKSYAKGRD